MARKAAATPKPTARPKPIAKPKPAAKAKPAAKSKPVAKAAPVKAAEAAFAPPPRLDRPRRRLSDIDDAAFNGTGSDERLLSSARSGHDELRSELLKHTESGPELTAGDVDANWQDAYAVGDEAPGGDNPTPDQDRVDDIGRALGIEYDDDEELMGGDELAERDEHRWELDPASRDDDD